MPKSVAVRFEGVHCPLVTPFDGEHVDEDALGNLVEYVLDGGVDGLVPTGTTGEFASLSDAEYQTVLETTIEHANGAPVMAGTADTSVAGTLSKIETAADLGADAALITLPYFHGSNDPTGDTTFIRRVADESTLPVYLYNLPSCVGRAIETETLLDVADHDHVYGLKDSSGDFNAVSETLRRTPNSFQLFQGFDSHLVPSLLFGATGGINALSNVLPGAFAEAFEAVERGDVSVAREIHENRIAPLFQQCIAHGFAPATKAALQARGVIDNDDVRPPLTTLDSDARTNIASVVDSVSNA
ncbi:dihydrodipicolinate synthase family protein [Haloferax sp. DFSO52]|uniref:dihydrodipicolinate synthase family protein n=1 Tax=Haloferax sp. DFSO52 TaxID=3388505 RepID=UPI003A8A68C6